MDENIWETQSQFVIKATYMLFDNLFKRFFLEIIYAIVKVWGFLSVWCMGRRRGERKRKSF